MDDFVSFYQICKLYNLKEYGLAIDERKFINLVEAEEIKGYIKNNHVYILIPSFEKYLGKIDDLHRDYLSLYEFIKDLKGLKEDIRGISPYLPCVLELTEKTCLELLVLDIPLNKKEKYFIKKSGYDKFKQDYISVVEAHNTLSISSSIRSFRELLTRHEISVIKFSKEHNLSFIKKEELSKLENASSGVIVRQAIEELAFTNTKSFYDVLKQYNIKIRRGKKQNTFIEKEEFVFLKRLQDKTYTHLINNYYTFDQIQNLISDIGRAKVNTQHTKKFAEDIPTIAQIKKFKGKFSVYRKKDVDKYIDEKKMENQISILYDSTTNDYPLLLKSVLEIENTYFSEKAKLTEKHWFKYAYWKLSNINGNDQSNKSRVSNIRYTTRCLTQFTKDKELYEFTEAELNLCFFNDKVPIKYQKELYSFIVNTNESLEKKYRKKAFDLGKLNYKGFNSNPKEIKEIYSVDEYLSLYRFVSNSDRHKELSIEDLKQTLTDKRRYKKYDSIWLYTLIHMNNGWRKGDVIKFPRLSISLYDELNLNNIESLENLHLTSAQADAIVKYYRLKWFEHNKTKEKASFYCSSALTMAMAYAIILCEFRCRLLHYTEEKFLIHFYNKKNEVTETIHRNFFCEFEKDFKFESRKMNRTVLTYTRSVIIDGFNGDPIKISQHLRGHSNRDTTNGYISIPQEHMDFIVEQVFDMGFYGYIYEKVGSLLVGDKSKPKINQIENSIEIKSLLGDVVKLEDTSTYLKYLSEQREELGRYLEEYPKEELKEKMKLINFGLSPAKEENYQCFFATCIAKETDCKNCSFSIPHFYSLTTICERLKRTLNKYEEKYKNKDVPVGEKMKLYNLLILDYTKISEAKYKFGTEIIEMFINSKFVEFKNKLNALPEPESLLSLV
jgi:hypothetical protein